MRQGHGPREGHGGLAEARESLAGCEQIDSRRHCVRIEPLDRGLDSGLQLNVVGDLGLQVFPESGCA